MVTGCARSTCYQCTRSVPTSTLSHGRGSFLRRSPIGVGEDEEGVGGDGCGGVAAPLPHRGYRIKSGKSRKGVVDWPSPQPSPRGEGVFEGGPRSGSGKTKKGVGGDGCGGVAAPCPRPTVGTGSSPGRGRAWFALTPTLSGEGECDGRALKQPRLLAGVASVGSVSADPNQTQLEPSGVLVGSLFFLLSSPDPCDKNTGYGVQLLRQYYRPSGRARRRFWLFTRTPG